MIKECFCCKEKYDSTKPVDNLFKNKLYENKNDVSRCVDVKAHFFITRADTGESLALCSCCIRQAMLCAFERMEDIQYDIVTEEDEEEQEND